MRVNKSFDKAKLVSRGRKIISKVPKAKTKPRFTEKDFKKGLEEFCSSLAKEFIGIVNVKYKKKSYEFSKQEEILKSGAIDPYKLSKALDQDGAIVFINKGEIVKGITYKEFVSMLEFGRLDKGLEPDSILRDTFEEFRPVYKDKVRKHITGK